MIEKGGVDNGMRADNDQIVSPGRRDFLKAVKNFALGASAALVGGSFLGDADAQAESGPLSNKLRAFKDTIVAPKSVFNIGSEKQVRAALEAAPNVPARSELAPNDARIIYPTPPNPTGMEMRGEMERVPTVPLRIPVGEGREVFLNALRLTGGRVLLDSFALARTPFADAGAIATGEKTGVFLAPKKHKTAEAYSAVREFGYSDISAGRSNGALITLKGYTKSADGMWLPAEHTGVAIELKENRALRTLVEKRIIEKAGGSNEWIKAITPKIAPRLAFVPIAFYKKEEEQYFDEDAVGAGATVFDISEASAYTPQTLPLYGVVSARIDIPTPQGTAWGYLVYTPSAMREVPN